MGFFKKKAREEVANLFRPGLEAELMPPSCSNSYTSYFGNYNHLSSLGSNVYFRMMENLNKYSLNDLGNVEVEIKFGTLLDKVTKNRIYLPISSPVLLNPDTDFYFESYISGSNHKTANSTLNEYYRHLCENNLKAKYKHDKILDRFYKVDHEKIRASFINEACSEIISKKNIFHMHVHYPNAPYDIRLSVNREIPRPESLITDGDMIYSRHKDRLSYILPLFAKIDLTMVHETDNPRPIFELEIELSPEGICEKMYIDAINMVDLLQTSFK